MKDAYLFYLLLPNFFTCLSNCSTQIMKSKMKHYVFPFPNFFRSICEFSGLLPVRRTFLSILFCFSLVIQCLAIQYFTRPAVSYFENRQDDNAHLTKDTDYNRSQKGSALTKFVKVFYPLIMSATPIIAVTNALWKFKTYFPLYLNNLYGSDDAMGKNKVFMENQNKFACKLAAWSLGLSIPVKLLSLSVLLFHSFINKPIILWVFGLYFIDMVGFISELQFILMCNCLRIRFKEINKIIADIFSTRDINLEFRSRVFAKQWKFSNRSHFTPTKPKSRGYHILSNCCKRKKRIISTLNVKNSLFVVAPCTAKNFSLDLEQQPILFEEISKLPSREIKVNENNIRQQVRRLRLSHSKLCSALLNLNCMFEYLLLVSIFSSFLLVLLHSYFLIFGFIKVYVLSSRLDAFFWLVKSILRLACPLVISDLTFKQGKKAVELLSANISQSLTDKSCAEMEYFCEEVSSRDLSVSCLLNLFSLRSQLLTAAAAASTTYIVILVQLH